MVGLDIPRTEAVRIDALHQLGLLDTAPSESFDRITRMASQIFNLPIAAVSLTDTDRQWFKSRVGVDHCSIPREKAPCAQVTATAARLVVPDLLGDPDYADSPLAQTGARFYAGVPLITRQGFVLGALCVVGGEPRTASTTELGSLQDLAAMVMGQIEMQHAIGRIDSTSGMPNRNQFLDDFADMARDENGQRRYVVLLDIARQDQLNDGLRVIGPAFVDELIQDAARALRAAVGPGTTVYHVAATQFAFWSATTLCEDAYRALVSRRLAQGRLTSNLRFIPTLAIGIAPIVIGDTIPSEALRAAFAAAQDARECDDQVRMHVPDDDHLPSRKFAILSDFPEAVGEHAQLRLVFQPRIELKTGRCIGAEALLRWRHPTLDEIPPVEFIPIIEQTSCARLMTDWVLKAAMRQRRLWARDGLALQLSINISAANLEEEDLAQRVQLYLLKYCLRPDMIELELTESTIMGNGGRGMAQLQALADAGVPLAIDDFGTGYSSLAYLQRLPGRVVKIDQSFIRDLCTGTRNHRLVRTMIALAHDLGYRVVAEGVETAQTAEALRLLGCEEAQGYFFAPPMDGADFERWLTERAGRDQDVGRGYPTARAANG